jgi:predicted dehydrogenase
MKPLRIGLVGLPDDCGAVLFADELLKSIPGLELVAVADQREWLVEDFAIERGLAWTTDPMALMARDDVHAVILTSPASAYADQVATAARLGKHVLLDKPISTTLADADRIVSAGRKVKVLAAHPLRFAPSYRDVKACAIGRLTSGFCSTHMRPAPIEEVPDFGGELPGCYFAHAVHFTDFFRGVSGSEPTSVVAAIGNLGAPEAETSDYCIATYTFASGATMTLETARDAGDAPPLGINRGMLAGTKGEIEFHPGRERQNEICRNLLTEFRDCILERREPSPSAADGRAALEMVLAAQEAARTGQRVTFPCTGGTGSASWASGRSPSSPVTPGHARTVTIHAV